MIVACIGCKRGGDGFESSCKGLHSQTFSAALTFCIFFDGEAGGHVEAPPTQQYFSRLHGACDRAQCIVKPADDFLAGYAVATTDVNSSEPRIGSGVYVEAFSACVVPFKSFNVHGFE